MRSILFFVLALLLFLGGTGMVPVSAQASAAPSLSTTDLAKRGQVTTGLELTASLSKSAIAPGNPVSLITHLKNVSDKTRTVEQSNFLDDYTIAIQDENGNVFPPKRTPRHIGSGGPTGPVDIEPGEELIENYLLSDLYGFKKKGKYSIVVFRSINDPRGGTPNHNAGDVFSNTAILRVTDTLAQGLLLSYSIDKPALAVNTPLIMHLALINTSDAITTVQFDPKQNPLKLAVQDSKGDLLPGQPVATITPALDTAPRALQSGEMLEYTLRVETKNQLGAAGRYFITPSLQIISNKNIAQVYANTTMISLVNK